MPKTMELKKLSEESLTRQPEEVFDIMEKLGEGSYGSVYKAIHKESSEVLAIKQVAVDTDLQDIIKEISIMQQCDSPYVVKYYGSYFKNTDLWIVMEYCGAGSVLDIMKLRGTLAAYPRGEVVTLSEAEIATILSDTLKGLEYLHLRKKIHRDIKAGNILLNSEGHAKLADFGVAGQLTDTMAKRNTVIGTPFWMAPEVIQEIGYDCVADIWSLGITALEMAEGKAPYGEIHPMRAIFMIPTKPPPSFSKPDKWSAAFIDFVSRCLVKNPEERATASQLLQHEFVKNAQASEILRPLICEAARMRERVQSNQLSAAAAALAAAAEDAAAAAAKEDSGTMVPGGGGTLVHASGVGAGAGATDGSNAGTFIMNPTLTADDGGTLVVGGSSAGGGDAAESLLGTMVINEDDPDGDADEDTMKRNDTDNVPAAGRQYRPAFLDHFDEKAAAAPSAAARAEAAAANAQAATTDTAGQAQQHALAAQPPHGRDLQSRFNQIAGGAPPQIDGGIGGPAGPAGVAANDGGQAKMPKSLAEGDLEFIKYLSHEELLSKMANLDHDMEREIDDLRRRYHAKRQPILDAMDQKKRRQQNF